VVKAGLGGRRWRRTGVDPRVRRTGVAGIEHARVPGVGAAIGTAIVAAGHEKRQGGGQPGPAHPAIIRQRPAPG